MTSIIIRDAKPEDADTVLKLNAAEVQWTSPISPQRLEELAGLSCYYKVVCVNDEVVAFLIAMHSTSQYENANFEWFKARYDQFVYIDRIVVAGNTAGLGLGSRFYGDIAKFASESNAERLVCEYNIEPMNEASRAFHLKIGFTEVGKQAVSEQGKIVSMQTLELENNN